MKTTIPAWLVVVGCAALSTLTDTLGTVYWEQRRPITLVGTVVLAPIVFVLFGYVGARLGLAAASGFTNSLIVAGPMLVGLVLRREAQQLAPPQLAGLMLIFLGIGLVALSRPTE